MYIGGCTSYQATQRRQGVKTKLRVEYSPGIQLQKVGAIQLLKVVLWVNGFLFIGLMDVD